MKNEGYLRENYHYFHLRDTAGQERDFHFHEFDKAVILLSGRVEYTVEDVTYALRPYDILLVKHHTIHKAVIDQSEPYERVIIYLDRKYFDRIMPEAKLTECFERTGRLSGCLYAPREEQREALQTALEAMERAQGDSGSYGDALRDTFMLQLLIQINRIVADGRERGRVSEGSHDPKIRQAMSYINENLSAQLSVEQLAERVFLSKFYFMRLFKAETGQTVHAYIRQKRLLNAARLIRGGQTAAEAAAESGFADYSVFHRAFRENFGISPGELKK